jgi:predicted aminopeptidase
LIQRINGLISRSPCGAAQHEAYRAGRARPGPPATIRGRLSGAPRLPHLQPMIRWQRWLALAAVLIGAALVATCSPMYVLRAGVEEAKILSRRRPIARVIEDPATNPVVRAKLELVLQARTFAERDLGLAAGESYTTYSWVESDTLLLVVSGARRDRFEAYTWWFPIVGRVPYKGFFDFDQALREAASLEERGFDSYVRPAAAFSTLGWFNDPLLNTLLRHGDVDLVSTVIHEILHNTIFLPGQVAFNESYANFVGDRGAIEYFCALEGETGERCIGARDGWDDTRRFGRFLSGLVEELEALYARPDLTLETLLPLREALFDRHRARFEAEVAPAMRRQGAFGWFVRRPINNATLIGTRLYYQRLDVFEAILAGHDGDLVAAMASIGAAARSQPGAPFEAVERLAEGAP